MVSFNKYAQYLFIFIYCKLSLLSKNPHDIDTNVLEEPLFHLLVPRHHECLIIATKKRQCLKNCERQKKLNNNKKDCLSRKCQGF